MAGFDFNPDDELFDLYLNSPGFLGSDDMFRDENFYATIWDGKKFITPDQWAMSAAS